MGKLTIDIGTVANDGTGDPGRTAFDSVNKNFTELYNVTATALQSDGSVDSIGNQLFSGRISVGSNADFTGEKSISIAETFTSPIGSTICSHITSTLDGTGNAYMQSAQEFAIFGTAGTWSNSVNGARYAPVLSGGTYSEVNGGNTLVVASGATITDAACFKAKLSNAIGTITNVTGYGVDKHSNLIGTLTNVSSFWAEKQTNGTNNYGFVLNGDGIGADIVLGEDQDNKIYHDGTRLRIDGITYSSQADTEVTGYIEVSIDGTLRKLAVIDP